jgi:hypothetical protein
MKRQALPDKRLPEWEEMCAVAASVQASSLTTVRSRVRDFPVSGSNFQIAILFFLP